MARLIALLIVFLPAAAVAQQPQLEITPFIGLGGGGEISVKDSQLTADRTVGVDLVRSGNYGVRFDHPLAGRPNLAVEFMVSLQQTQLEDVQKLFGERPSGPTRPEKSGILDVNLSYLHAGALWEVGRLMQPYEFRPYVVGTIGLTHIDSQSPLRDDQRPSVSGGVGLKWFLQPRLALRLETRGYWTFTDETNRVTVPIENRDCSGTCLRVYSYPSNFYQFDTTLGFSWAF